MKTQPTLALFTALLLATLVAHAQEQLHLPTTVRDRLWLFACPPAGTLHYLENAGCAAARA